jgi:hypothetical protein
MKNLILLFISILAFSTNGIAQTTTEAFRFSASDPIGTARNMGTGNSMFAIGADFSAIASNPAGIGSYWKSEFVLTTGLAIHNYSSTIIPDSIGNETTGAYSHLRLPNLGFVVTTRGWNSKWQTSNWAIGINRVADYNQEINFRGRTLGSMTDSWRENAQGLDTFELNEFEEVLAFESGALYDIGKDRTYETDYQLNPNYALYKEENTQINGGKSEIFIGYGANLDNKLLIGGSINVPILNSESSRTYEEIDGSEDGVEYFNDLLYTSDIFTSGFGLNAKVGVTVKPSKFFNIALAVHSPTRYRLTDDYNTTLTYDFTDGNHDGPIRAESDLGSFDYAFTSPWSVLGGIGIIGGQSGFVSASVKYTDYSSMKYDYSIAGNGSDFTQAEREINNEIRNTFGSAIDLNIGGELAVQQMRFRGGVMLSQSAYLNDKTFDPSYHLGLGYRGETYFVDLGYSLAKKEEGYLPYLTNDAPQPLAVIETTRHRIAATLGLKF